MKIKSDFKFKSNLLCIAPPYGNRIAAGCAYLFGYLKAHDCHDFDFLDLRLGAPFDFTPSYKTTGVFGEAYVLDIPDLPLVLHVLNAFKTGGSLAPKRCEWFDHYCLERGISPNYLEAYLASLDRFLELSFSQLSELDVIGFATWTPNYLSTLMAAAHVKRRRKPPLVIAGGPQVTSSSGSAELGLRSGLFDVVVLSEGEQTLLDLYRTFRNGGDIKQVPGTCIINGSGEMATTERKQLKLDSLPIPSFDEMPLGSYQERHEFRALPYQLSRGCTDKCSFCSEWVFWRRYRSDTAEHAVAQIDELLKRYNAGFIEFSDSLLNGHPRRLTAFAEQVLAQELTFGWTSFMRAQMDAETARLLARSGCTGVFIGIESFSDEALELMNKRCTEAQNIQAIIAFVEAGIHVTAGFIPGFPGDSRNGFLHSVSVVNHLQERYPGRIELHEEPFTVMANAPIMKQLDQMGLTARFWSPEYLDLCPQYGDTTSRVVCSVEGREQGLERMGRTTLVGAIKTDAPVLGKFDEGSNEEIEIDRFSSTHIFGGWHLVCKKAMAGHRYCLVLNDDEWSLIKESQEEWFPVDENRADIAQVLDGLEALHLVPPSRFTQELTPTFFRCRNHKSATFRLSPFIVARDLGWRYHHQLMIVDTVTGLEQRRSCAESEIIRALIGKQMSGTVLARKASLKKSFPERNKLFEVLDKFRDLGILLSMPEESERQDPPPIPPRTITQIGPYLQSENAIPASSFARQRNPTSDSNCRASGGLVV